MSRKQTNKKKQTVDQNKQNGSKRVNGNRSNKK